MNNQKQCENCYEEPACSLGALCVYCLSQSVVTEMLDSWMANMSSQPDLNWRGVDLYGGTEFSMSLKLMPAVLSYLEKLDAEHSRA